jgi:hypothetical protein
VVLPGSEEQQNAEINGGKKILYAIDLIEDISQCSKADLTAVGET